MEKIKALQAIVTNRRSIKPTVFNGKNIKDHEIRQLLDLGNWAPTHGFTEPWRFIVYSGKAVRQFCGRHAELYRQATAPDNFNPGKYEKLQHNGDKSSHLVLVFMKRGANANIPELEELCSAAAAVQNILLGAEALGISVLWSSGGMILHPAMKTYLGLDDTAIVIGLLYMGYTDEPGKPGKRMAVEAKTTWIDHLEEPSR
jgi:nitroreductase